MLRLKNYCPVEINRKARQLSELPRWKATEFRNFLWYYGPVVLKSVCKQPIYKHFLLLHVAVTIFASDKYISQDSLGTNLANELLYVFVNHCSKLYGLQFLIYNVHLLIHLQDDVDNYGPLDHYSCFPFENCLGQIKNLVKSPTHPLQ